MKTPPPLIIFFFLLLTIPHHITAAPNQNLITDTCIKSSQTDPNISYDFCLSSLRAAAPSDDDSTDDPNLDLPKLAVISVNLVQRNATHTKRFINRLLTSDRDDHNRTKLDPYVRACLQDCFTLYSDAIPSLAQAVDHINSRRFDDANTEVGSVLDAASTCEDQFGEMGSNSSTVVSPLTGRNKAAFQLCAISLSIINMLRQSSLFVVNHR